MNRRRLTSQLHQQELDLLARSEAASAAVERAVRAVWRRLLVVLVPGEPWLLTQRRAAAILRELPAVLGVVAERLADAVADSFRAAERALVPAKDLREDLGPGFGSLAVDVLLKGPTRDQVHALVYSTGWHQRLAQLTRLADPESLASTLAAAIAGGATPRQAAKLIAPVVQDVQESARRIARHETIRVAHEARLAAYEQLGTELVIGYQIHAVLDARTRPEHRRRDGAVYYREPTGGQRGFAEMPRPPMEADGSVSWNCRCFLTPVLR